MLVEASFHDVFLFIAQANPNTSHSLFLHKEMKRKFPEPRTSVQTSVPAPQRLKMRWRQVLTDLKHLTTIYKKKPQTNCLNSRPENLFISACIHEGKSVRAFTHRRGVTSDILTSLLAVFLWDFQKYPAEEESQHSRQVWAEKVLVCSQKPDISKYKNWKKKKIKVKKSVMNN